MTNQIQSVRGRVMRHASRYMLMGLLIAGTTWASAAMAANYHAEEHQLRRTARRQRRVAHGLRRRSGAAAENLHHRQSAAYRRRLCRYRQRSLAPPGYRQGFDLRRVRSLRRWSHPGGGRADARVELPLTRRRQQPGTDRQQRQHGPVRDHGGHDRSDQGAAVLLERPGDLQHRLPPRSERRRPRADQLQRQRRECRNDPQGRQGAGHHRPRQPASQPRPAPGYAGLRHAGAVHRHPCRHGRRRAHGNCGQGQRRDFGLPDCGPVRGRSGAQESRRQGREAGQAGQGAKLRRQARHLQLPGYSGALGAAADRRYFRVSIWSLPTASAAASPCGWSTCRGIRRWT